MLIQQYGGFEAMLNRCAPSDRKQMRFLMDQYVTRDVFGCLTTGKAPTFLVTGFETWWFATDHLRGGRDDIVTMFGITRGLIDFMARVRGRFSERSWLVLTRQVCSVVAEQRRIDEIATERSLMEIMHPEDEATGHEDLDAAREALMERAGIFSADLGVWTQSAQLSNSCDERFRVSMEVKIELRAECSLAKWPMCK